MFGLITRTLYGPFKAAVLSAWNAAKADAFSEIRAEIQSETETSPDDALADLRPIEDKKKKK